MTPRFDLLELFAELDDVVDAWAWNIALSGGRIDRSQVIRFRSHARLDLLNELAVQRSLAAVEPIENGRARSQPASARPSAEPPH